MPPGVQQTFAALPTIFPTALVLFLSNPAFTAFAALLYTIGDFTRRKQEKDLFTHALHSDAEYAHQTPRFLRAFGDADDPL